MSEHGSNLASVLERSSVVTPQDDIVARFQGFLDNREGEEADESYGPVLSSDDFARVVLGPDIIPSFAAEGASESATLILAQLSKQIEPIEEPSGNKSSSPDARKQFGLWAQVEAQKSSRPKTDKKASITLKNYRAGLNAVPPVGYHLVDAQGAPIGFGDYVAAQAEAEGSRIAQEIEARAESGYVSIPMHELSLFASTAHNNKIKRLAHDPAVINYLRTTPYGDLNTVVTLMYTDPDKVFGPQGMFDRLALDPHAPKAHLLVEQQAVLDIVSYFAAGAVHDLSKNPRYNANAQVVFKELERIGVVQKCKPDFFFIEIAPHRQDLLHRVDEIRRIMKKVSPLGFPLNDLNSYPPELMDHLIALSDELASEVPEGQEPDMKLRIGEYKTRVQAPIPDGKEKNDDSKNYAYRRQKLIYDLAHTVGVFEQFFLALRRYKAITAQETASTTDWKDQTFLKNQKVSLFGILAEWQMAETDGSLLAFDYMKPLNAKYEQIEMEEVRNAIVQREVNTAVALTYLRRAGRSISKKISSFSPEQPPSTPDSVEPISDKELWSTPNPNPMVFESRAYIVPYIESHCEDPDEKYQGMIDEVDPISYEELWSTPNPYVEIDYKIESKKQK